MKNYPQGRSVASLSGQRRAEKGAESTRKWQVPESGTRAKRGGETTRREMSLVPLGRQGVLGHEAKKEVLYYIFERSRGCGEGLETCYQLCDTLTASFSRIPECGRPPRLAYWG